jgi:hypothetical protein
MQHYFKTVARAWEELYRMAIGRQNGLERNAGELKNVVKVQIA